MPETPDYRTRVWPPSDRTPFGHDPHCAIALGQFDGDRPRACDCEVWAHNMRVQAFWEGYDAAQEHARATIRKSISRTLGRTYGQNAEKPL